MAQQLVMKGYLKCDTCGAVFDSPLLDPPCYQNGNEINPSYEECSTCSRYLNAVSKSKGRLICPVCLSAQVHKISGWEVRIIKYFRK